jgi:hypothetical protein
MSRELLLVVCRSCPWMAAARPMAKLMVAVELALTAGPVGSRDLQLAGILCGKPSLPEGSFR